ncbi:MAG TPA: 4-hydroxy-3-methylbut-2-en-1-yl diphosphate synthase, partial [Proteobacteria bacterium]|nr:4-hydroxy-3-methylbut-2-en-1-yl diphosphate synthase [Pseudomonadota bacterium]
MRRRKRTRTVFVGDVPIGGGRPIVVQSMTKTFTEDCAATLRQIRALAKAGCQIVRCAVPNREAAASLKRIVANSPIPVIADIHFDYKLALEAIRSGAHGIRINPGTIGAKWKV